MTRNRVSGIGDHNAYCQACGEKYKISQLRRRPEDNMWVCVYDWEGIHGQKFSRNVPERLNAGGGGWTQVPGLNTHPDVGPDINNNTTTPIYFPVLTEDTTVYKGYAPPVTANITVTVVEWLIIDGVEFGAGTYTGPSADWDSGGCGEVVYTVSAGTLQTVFIGYQHNDLDEQVQDWGSIAPNTFWQPDNDNDPLEVGYIFSRTDSEYTQIAFLNLGVSQNEEELLGTWTIDGFGTLDPADAAFYINTGTVSGWRWTNTVAFPTEGDYTVTLNCPS